MKKIILSLILVLFAASAAAQPLQNFDFSSEYDLTSGGDIAVTGGEAVRGTVTFENQVNRDLPLVVKLEVSSDEMRVTGEEFSLDVAVLSSNASDGEIPVEDLFRYPDNYEEDEIPPYSSDDDSRVTRLECSVLSPSRNSSVYRCLSDGEEIVSRSGSRSSFNNVSVEASAVPNIMPGSYNFELKVLSEVGVGGETVNKSVNASEPVKVSTSGNETSVMVNSSAESNVTVQQVTEISDPNSESDEFVGGVSVDVSNSSGEVDASGVVTISYESDSYDDDDVNVFFYNDTRDANDWVSVGGTQYPSNNTVSAEVSHFSTYGAFVEQVSDSSGSDEEDESSSAGPISFTPDEQEQDSPQNESQGQDPGSEPDDESQQQQEQESGENQEQSQSDSTEDTGSENTGTDGSQSQGITGQFASSPSGIAALVFALVALILAYLQYSGRVNFRDRIPF